MNDILENDDIFEEEVKEEIIDDKNETEISEEEVVSEQLPNDENSPENLVQTVQYLLPKIERILEDDELALQYTSELELFKKLLDLCEFLPEDIKKEFLTSKVRLQIEYVIAKMSGKPGLLKTAHSLLKSGVISDSYVATTSEEEMNVTNEVLFNLIDYTKKLSEDLEDKTLAEGLQTYADSVLEQIELQNLSAQIFE